jgi:hypothetical protein
MRKVKEVVAEFEAVFRDIPVPADQKELEAATDVGSVVTAVMVKAMNEILLDDYKAVHNARGGRVESVQGVLRECDARWQSFATQANAIVKPAWSISGDLVRPDAAKVHFSKTGGLVEAGLEFDADYNIVPKGAL